MSSDWTAKRTVKGKNFKRRRQNQNEKIMPKSKKDFAQDKELKNMKKKIKKLEGEPELKYKDTGFVTIEAVSDPDTANIVLLNGLAQGTTSTTRIGEEVMMTSIQLRGFILGNTANVAGDIVRLMVVYEKETNGGVPDITTILENVASGAYINAPYQSAYLGSFKVLYDETFSINPQLVVTTASGSTTVVGSVVHPINVRIPINKKTNYGISNNGDVTDISLGGLFLFVIGRNTDVSNLGSNFSCSARVYYRDN